MASGGQDGMVILWDYMGDRCLYSTVDLNVFQGMHVGLGLGPMSTYMTEQYEAADWWDPEGDFKPLHQLNPVRLDYIAARCDLADSTVLDVLL